MDDRGTGLAIRTIRVRKGWRQADLAIRARVSRSSVGRIERGRLDRVPLGTLRRVAAALDASVAVSVRWHGGDLTRLVNARHAAMHERIAHLFRSLPGWQPEPEVLFSIYGERGVVDVLAWHATTRTVLVIELKTQIVDINELMGTLDRKRRLATSLAHARQWPAASVASLVLLADDRANRRALATHAEALRAKFPADGRVIRGWLRHPDGPIDGLGFMPLGHAVDARRDLVPTRRVVPRKRAAVRA